MSLNTAHAPGGVLVFTGELILLYCDGVQVTFEGADARKFQGTTKGRIYLNTHRVVFVHKYGKDFLQSFSFPFLNISDLKLEQPFFGANYIQGKVTSEKNGNWTGKCTFKLKFMKGGAIEFGQAMMAAIKCASLLGGGAAPGSYQPPSEPYMPLRPDDHMPGQGVNYGFPLPYAAFPDQPPAKTVFATSAPPPYPGVYVPPQQSQAGMPSAPMASSSSGSNSSAAGSSAPPAGFKQE
ncbi:WW domain-binding protein 2-like [Amblyomma americanum]